MKHILRKKEGRKPLSKKALYPIIIGGYLFIVFILIAVANVISASLAAQKAKTVWTDWQVEYVDFLEKSYAADANFCKVDEASFLTSGLTRADLYAAKLNDVRFLASHNSYKTGLTPETKLLYHAPFAAFMGKQYDYVFDTITEQLNCGIRSIELDPNKVITDDGFKIECLHSDALETNSTFINFELGLREIKMWMDRNPNAVPITVLIEPKGGDNFDTEAFDALDKMLFEVFGDKLYTPDDMLGDYADFDELRADNGYPTVAKTKGKIMFLLHEKDSLKFYLERDPSMRKSAMFVAVTYKTLLRKHPEYSKYAFVTIINEPTKHDDWIEEAVNEGNYMVRTRLDKYAVIREKDYNNGLASGANILSTDYTPHVSERIYPYPTGETWTDTYFAVLYEKDKTITLRNSK